MHVLMWKCKHPMCIAMTDVGLNFCPAHMPPEITTRGDTMTESIKTFDIRGDGTLKCAKTACMFVAASDNIYCENHKLKPVETEIQLPTEGIKHDTGKPPLSLISYESLIGEARALEYGAGKYGKNNYKLGMDWSRLLDAAMRHISAFAHGESNDPESSLSHLFHAKASLGMLIYYVENELGKDDR